jgi:prefoldin subunit 4|uniref:Prefoldin subunit 4 n=1 Tax=Tetraselmis chuii TaxID=63592 RepID=A0A7S1SV60_9CHLO|mmetsp:Transcript_30034/g.53732  ORF Transcript_30034/g.53732 Transcript_30034/m.53732 type:complete len:118 (+) Transcript_30034:117-470(+)
MEVTLEDQESINLYSRLNNRRHELEAELSAKKKAAEDLEDAGNELMLSDEPEAMYLVGECFLHFTNDEAEERVNAAVEGNTGELERVEGELRGVNTKMQTLKAQLYGKFGNSINLEE